MAAVERRRRWRIGLAVQLDLVLALVVLAMGGGLGAFFVRAQTREMEDALEERIRLVGAYLATAAEVPMARGRPAELDGLLNGLALDPEIAYVLVKTPQGDVRAARWMATNGAVFERDFPIHRRSTASTQEPFGAVHDPDASVVGSVSLGVDLSPLTARRTGLVGRTLAVLLLAAALAAILGHVVSGILLRGAIERLLAGIRAVAAGDLGHRMRLEVRTSEVAEMGRAFDEMAERLSRTLVSKAALEETVAARTEELTEALQQELRTQEALAEREAHVRLLLDSTAEAIYGVDLAGRCSFANPACARLLGYASPEELVGREMHALVHHSLADGAPLAARDCRIVRSMAEGREYHADDEVYWRADGTPLAIECWCYPVRRAGRPIGSVITFLDVTERRRLEGELLNMRKLESLGVLAGGIAHDFNNILTGVLGNLSLAREQVAPGSELSELVVEAEQAAKRARALTQQLLTFSRGGAPVKRVISARAVVEDAATFALRGSAVRGQLSSAEGLWAVEADPGQLAQVVQNLVINAVQAMPGGGTIAISCDNDELGASAAVPLAAGRYVRVSVRDEGTGIPPEHLGRIFDPYFTTKQTGSGLGLATVYAIVRKHGGHIAVSSRRGGGTTFDVWLPATGRAASEQPDGARPAPQGRGRVLVMDDEALVRSTATVMLATLGYEVLQAEDGARAVELYDSERSAGRPVAAVLMDLTVPGGQGGVETLKRLRAIDPAVRAVATSGYSNDPVMAAHAQYGFAGVLPKPYTLDDLARAVAAALVPRAEAPGEAALGPAAPVGTA